MNSQQIARAAAYYARATAIRVVHGVLPEPDPEADALFWKETMPSIQAEILGIVEAIFAAANPQPTMETHEEDGYRDEGIDQGWV